MPPTQQQKAIHNCTVCGQPRHHLAYCCKACKKLLDRIETRGRRPNRNARLNALRNAWDGKCFRCFYTGWPLCIDDPHNPFYLTWEHRTPRDEADIVVAAALVNNMKSDLTEDEFRELIIGLADRFRGSNTMVPIIDPSHYRR
jgi:hypothetical protein